MTRFRKKIVIMFSSLVLIIVFIYIAILVFVWPDFRRYNHTLDYILDTLMFYTDSHQGKLPECEEDLIREGFLRKKEKGDTVIYEISTHSDSYWRELSTFSEIKIPYGLEINDVECRDGFLFNKHTGQPIFLLDGPRPWPWLYTKLYKQYSKLLYDILDSNKLSQTHEPNSLEGKGKRLKE